VNASPGGELVTVTSEEWIMQKSLGDASVVTSDPL